MAIDNLVGIVSTMSFSLKEKSKTDNLFIMLIKLSSKLFALCTLMVPLHASLVLTFINRLELAYDFLST